MNNLYCARPEFTKENPKHCEGFEGPCENTEAEWVRMNCQYQNERSNWRYMCEECAIVATEYWREMWDEYWSMVI